MKILLVGSGAREHALAWKMSASPLLDALYCAPGNAGTALYGSNVDIRVGDVDRLAEFAASKDIDLVVVGPELPLALGLADKLSALSRDGRPRCFGPSSAAARIESSKSFSKDFMRKYGIPTADFRVFSSYDEALNFSRNAPWPFVIKASGLASGKGVFLPSSNKETEDALAMIMKDGRLGDAGAEVIIEERLVGEEVSILGFCDGSSVGVMPPAQDHKRLLENDAGPNTGGMGAIASAKSAPFGRARGFAELFLKKACEGLASEGTPFVGVLYAGLILTKDGPKALEYNCRFGDPETEAILPLLESDIVEIFDACAKGSLGNVKIDWADKAAACVIIASERYAIDANDGAQREVKDFGGRPDSVLFHAATYRDGDGKVMASGGRLLCASAWADSVDEALEEAYARVARVEVPFSRYRKDIGRGKTFLTQNGWEGNHSSAAAASASEAPAGTAATKAPGGSAASYASAGVDIDAGDRAVDLMSAAVKSTYGPEVLAGIGSFGGMYDASALKAMDDPVLVSSTDGVGTKVKLAAFVKSYDSVGQDIVNHCVDDILVQGARPLFFLDYIATSKLDPSMIAEAVGGMAAACRESGCALIGGETAEMPGVYMPNEFDVAGAIVGLAEKKRMLPLKTMRAGDLLLGFPSSGPHTNGFSLIRKIFSEEELRGYAEILGRPLAEALLAPHRSYLPILWPVLQKGPGLIKALAHITGAGFEGNVPRILPPHLDAHIRMDSWPMPPLFHLIMEKGGIDELEMYRVFNMGIGMVAVVAPEAVDSVARLSGNPFYVIGELKPGVGAAIMEKSGRVAKMGSPAIDASADTSRGRA
ncbi:MAG TPA: phosphoribosylamine--glycine ligase [Rectinemataceae bacterium]|nr:phosphoribosylamine--glycine ligase [Rectinemataceae bacterium]